MTGPTPSTPSRPLRYLTLAAPATAELEVRRSRFICDVAPASSEEAARAFVEQVRSTSRDARHHCTAYVLGADGATLRSNDDGEPSGTAGAPMLDVLRGRGLTDVVAVVTRWFGGTLLGTGGLIRAYGDAVSLALDGATVVARELREACSSTSTTRPDHGWSTHCAPSPASMSRPSTTSRTGSGSTLPLPPRRWRTWSGPSRP
ncbi:hypothetical protein GCM10009817_00720 [Terrabacter lapilli]|uniref:Impact N-terminal domain-containing protein n=1 Tax=Terrabacter lapilli TaxID=436231 RepID=A0ABN2R7G0_9MICO